MTHLGLKMISSNPVTEAKKIAKEREYPQLWERESDGERFSVNPDGTVEELSEEDKVFKTGL